MMQIHVRLLRAAALLLAGLALAGCSSLRPWINQPVPDGVVPREEATLAPAPRPVGAAVTLSGGSARAAAFGLGVLQELLGLDAGAPVLSETGRGEEP